MSIHENNQKELGLIDVQIYLRRRFMVHAETRIENYAVMFESELLPDWTRKLHAETEGDHIPVEEFDKMCQRLLDS